MIGDGPSFSGVKTRACTGPAAVSRILSSTPATSTTAPVMVGVHRARNEVRTSSMGNSHCGARAFASLASMSFSSAECSGILKQCSHADTLTVKAESGSATRPRAGRWHGARREHTPRAKRMALGIYKRLEQFTELPRETVWKVGRRRLGRTFGRRAAAKQASLALLLASVRCQHGTIRNFQTVSLGNPLHSPGRIPYRSFVPIAS